MGADGCRTRVEGDVTAERITAFGQSIGETSRFREEQEACGFDRAAGEDEDIGFLRDPSAIAVLVDGAFDRPPPSTVRSRTMHPGRGSWLPPANASGTKPLSADERVPPGLPCCWVKALTTDTLTLPPLRRRDRRTGRFDPYGPDPLANPDLRPIAPSVSPTVRRERRHDCGLLRRRRFPGRCVSHDGLRLIGDRGRP